VILFHKYDLHLEETACQKCKECFLECTIFVLERKQGGSDTDTSSPAKINLTLLTTGQQHTEDLSSTQLEQISQHLGWDLNILGI
jgi:MinD superfamily P-loop ATPase